MFGGMKDISKETNEMFSFNFRTQVWTMFQTEQQIQDPVSAAMLEEFKGKKNSPQRRHTVNLSNQPQPRKSEGKETSPDRRHTNLQAPNKKSDANESSPMIERNYARKKTLYDGPGSPIEGRVKGNHPHQRDGHTAVVLDSVMYIFGGDRHQMPFSDLYAYRLDEEAINTPIVDINTS